METSRLVAGLGGARHPFQTTSTSALDAMDGVPLDVVMWTAVTMPHVVAGPNPCYPLQFGGFRRAKVRGARPPHMQIFGQVPEPACSLS